MYYTEYINEVQTSMILRQNLYIIYVNLFSWTLRYVNFVRAYFEAKQRKMLNQT